MPVLGGRRLVESSAELVQTPAVEPNGHLDAAEAQTLRWALHHGLVSPGKEEARFAAIRCGSCAAHTYPRASAEVVELGANLIGWLFLFDDAYGEWSGEIVALETTLQTFEPLLFHGELPSEPLSFHLALADLRQRLLALGGRELVQRFAYSMRRYFEGCFLEFPYRKTGRSPSLSVYRSLRRWSIGVLPVLDLVELTLVHPLEAAMAGKESVWALRDRAATLCAWANDLYSFHKERDDRDPHNLVSVLMRERHLPIEDAFTDAVRLYNADLAAFERAILGFTIAPSTSTLEVAYLRGVCDWVYGNHQWTRESRRYR